MFFKSIGIFLISIIVCGTIGFVGAEVGTGLHLYGGGSGNFTSPDLDRSLLIIFEVMIGFLFGGCSGLILVIMTATKMPVEHHFSFQLIPTAVFALGKGGLLIVLVYGRLGISGLSGDDYQKTWELILLEAISGGLMFLIPCLVVSKFLNANPR